MSKAVKTLQASESVTYKIPQCFSFLCWLTKIRKPQGSEWFRCFQGQLKIGIFLI